MLLPGSRPHSVLLSQRSIRSSGTIFDQLRGRGLDQSAAWVITSDLGYPLGEHGQIGVHRPWLHEELVHTPLIVHLPGGSEAGRRVSALTQPADVADAIVDLLCSEHLKAERIIGAGTRGGGEGAIPCSHLTGPRSCRGMVDPHRRVGIAVARSDARGRDSRATSCSRNRTIAGKSTIYGPGTSR